MLKFYPDPDVTDTYEDRMCRTATATYRADSNEINTNGKVNIVDNKVADVQSMKMVIW